MKTSAFAGFAVLVCLLFGASPTAALEAACLWDNLAPAKRAEVMRLYRANGLSALNRIPLVDADLKGWTTRCGVTMANIEATGHLFGTIVIEKGAIEILSEEFGVTEVALKAAWEGVTPTARASLRRLAVEVMSTGKATREDRAAGEQVLRALKLPRQARTQVNLYLTALTMREVLNGR